MKYQSYSVVKELAVPGSPPQMFQIERLNIRLGVMVFIGNFEEDCARLQIGFYKSKTVYSLG